MAESSTFFWKKCPFTLLCIPIFFFIPEFLELFFTPKNTPPKLKNSKLDKSPILFGTPNRMSGLSTGRDTPFFHLQLDPWGTLGSWPTFLVLETLGCLEDHQRHPYPPSPEIDPWKMVVPDPLSGCRLCPVTFQMLGL